METKLQNELRTSNCAPFPFKTKVSTSSKVVTNGPARVINVEGLDPSTGAALSREYRLDNSGQSSYLDFFSALAAHFGTRVPRNRQEREPSTAQAPYQALLTRNITPDILYGYGDPAVIRICERWVAQGSSRYYLVATSNDAPNSFPLLRSDDLVNWMPAGFVFPQGSKPEWVLDGEQISDFWAPEMHQVGQEFFVCFSARDKSSSLAIGIAKASRPEGPFMAAPMPVLGGGVIDPHMFVVDDGTVILYWKEDTNGIWPALLARLLHENPSLITELYLNDRDQRTACFVSSLWPWMVSSGAMERFFLEQVLIEATIADFSEFRNRLAGLGLTSGSASARSISKAALDAMRTRVYAQRLASGSSALIGERVLTLENDQEWEGHLIEGIWVIKHCGKYYMFYSGNDFSTSSYGIGVAFADNPFGPYEKLREPILRSTSNWSGPGHPSIALDLDDQPRMFFHGFFPGKAGYKEFRALLSVGLSFVGDRVLLRE